MTGREKGCYFAAMNQNSVRMNKNSNRPKDCPGSHQQTRASPICPVGRILISTEISKLCAAALASLSVPHHHLAPLVQNPPELDFPLRGRAVSIRQFSTHVSLKILQDYG